MTAATITYAKLTRRLADDRHLLAGLELWAAHYRTSGYPLAALDTYAKADLVRRRIIATYDALAALEATP